MSVGQTIVAAIPAVYLAVGLAFLILVALTARMPGGLGKLVIVLLWPALLVFLAFEKIEKARGS